MKKNIIILAVLVIVTTSLATFGNSSNIVGEFLNSVGATSIVQSIFTGDQKRMKKDEPLPLPSRNNISAQNVPDRITYLILFNHLAGLKKQAEQATTEATPSFNYMAVAKKEMSLDDAQAAYLFQAAEDCLSAIEPIDKEARTIILNDKESLGDYDESSIDDRLPLPPPPALATLQQQKDATVLQYRDNVANYLGNFKFTQFDQSVNEMIAPQVTLLGTTNMNRDGGAK